MNTPRRTRRAGFTLVEIMIAMTIFGVAMAAVMTWFLSMRDICNMSTGVALVSSDMRKLTTSMTDEGRNANRFILYSSFTDRTLKTAAGDSGDYLVLEISDDAGAIVRTIGYFRDVGANNEGPVRKHDSTQTGAPAPGAIPDTGTAASWPEVVELSKGLSGPDGKLFYLYGTNSFMVSGQIIQHGRRAYGNDDGRATSTYNFTITPRS